MQMIRNRGGPHTLGHTLRILINWMDYFNNGYQEAGPDSPFLRCHSYCIPFSHPHNTSAPHTLEELCNDFVSTFQNWEILSLSFRDASSSDTISKHLAVFGPRSSLHRLLCHRKSDPNVKIVRLAILLHLVCALWDYRLSPSQTASFLDTLQGKSPIFACCKTQHLATILWTLLQPELDADMRRPERSWFVGQMLRVAKRLGSVQWERVHGLLLGFLVGEAFEPPFTEWSEELKKEIMSAPVRSLIGPSRDY